MNESEKQALLEKAKLRANIEKVNRDELLKLRIDIENRVRDVTGWYGPVQERGKYNINLMQDLITHYLKLKGLEERMNWILEVAKELAQIHQYYSLIEFQNKGVKSVMVEVEDSKDSDNLSKFAHFLVTIKISDSLNKTLMIGSNTHVYFNATSLVSSSISERIKLIDTFMSEFDTFESNFIRLVKALVD